MLTHRHTQLTSQPLLSSVLSDPVLPSVSTESNFCIMQIDARETNRPQSLKERGGNDNRLVHMTRCVKNKKFRISDVIYLSCSDDTASFSNISMNTVLFVQRSRFTYLIVKSGYQVLLDLVMCLALLTMTYPLT